MTLDLSVQCWDRPDIRLMRRQEVSRTQGGITIKKDMGPALWHVSLSSFPVSLIEADALHAQLQALENDSVLIKGAVANWQPSHRGLLDGVSIEGVSGQRLSLAGLPAGLVLPIGARMSVITGPGREYFQLLDPSDHVGGFRVLPDIRNVLTGMNVELSPPLIEVMIEPGTIEFQYQTRLKKRVSFTAIQVLT